jgi:hypothetical protein
MDFIVLVLALNEMELVLEKECWDTEASSTKPSAVRRGGLSKRNPGNDRRNDPKNLFR